MTETSYNLISISKVCELFTDGNWIESKDQSTNGIRLVQTGNVGNGIFKDRRDKARWISEETFQRLKCQEVLVGDCLISRLPDPVGRSCIVPETGDKLITAVDCSILRFNPTKLLSNFFTYYSQSRTYQFDVEAQCTGATRKRISRKKLGNIKLPLPPLPEQQRIVSILDEAFKSIDQAIANTEKNLANARELFESYLNNVFTQKGEGWVDNPLGNIASVEYGYTDKSTSDGEFRYVRITDIDDKGELTLDKKKYIKYSEEAAKFRLKDNDLLMARTGATFAKVLLYKGHEESVFASYLIRINFTVNVNNALYWYFSKSKYYWDQANSLSSGAAQPHFNGAALKQMMFSYPESTKEQMMLIYKFKLISDEVNKLDTIYKKKLSNLKELKQSILQKAFSGELTSEDIKQ